MTRSHLSNYQRRDFEVVDYSMYELGDTGLSFRGPEPATLQRGNYIACVGAAQTLGCFCDKPYPSMLAEKLGLPCLNLGYGGAGPEFFVNHKELLPYINDARLVILQVMSGRSQSNSFYECDGLEYVKLRSDGRPMGATQAFFELYSADTWVPGWLGTSRIVRKLRAWTARPNARRIVAEIRSAWIESYASLVSAISVPVVLLWFSKRAPDYTPDFRRVGTLFGDFPQLVTREMVNAIRRPDVTYVECVTGRGSPQPLRSRFTGLPVGVDLYNDRPDFGHVIWTKNAYYPSPEMHADATDALVDAIRQHHEWA